MTDMSKIDNQIDNIRGLVSNAQNKIQNKEVVDLAGLNLKVQDLCRDVLSLPPAQAKEFKTTMLDIISSLNTLEESLKVFQNNMNNLKEKMT